MYNGVYDVKQYAYLKDTLVKWITIKVAGKSLGDKLYDMGIHEISIYGLGEIGDLVIKDIRHSKVKINFLIDKKAEEYGKYDEGIAIVSPESMNDCDRKGYILVTPEFYYRDILEMLLKQGISLEKIISISMIV